MLNIFPSHIYRPHPEDFRYLYFIYDTFYIILDFNVLFWTLDSQKMLEKNHFGALQKLPQVTFKPRLIHH